MSFLFGGSPPTPQPINLQKELQQTLAGETATAPGFAGLNQQYDPLYNMLGLQGPQNMEFGVGGQPGLLQQGIGATGLTAGGNIANVSGYGPEAQAAYLQANPALSGGISNIQSGMRSNPTLQGLQKPSQDLSSIASLARSQLSGVLPQDQLQQIEQQTQQQFARQGLAGSNPSLGAEAVNTAAAQQARQAAAQQALAGVQGQQFGQQLSAEQALQQQARLGQLGTQTIYNTTLNPWSAIVGGAGGLPTSSLAYNPTGLPGGPLAAQNAALQYQGQLNQYGAQQNQLNALGSSLGTAAGIGLAAAGFSDERIKEDITDTGRKTEDGIPIKRWRYKGSEEWFEGPIAQDVEKRRPDAE